MAPLVESINTKQKYNPVTVFATVRRRIYEYDRTILGVGSGGGRAQQTTGVCQERYDKG